RHRGPASFCQGGKLHPAAPERRWRLEHLRCWALQRQRFGEGLLRLEAGRIYGRPCRSRARSEEDSGNGRGHQSQYLYQNLSVLLWAVRLRCCACNPAGDRTLSQMVLVQHLRDFIVVARHSGTTVDLLREKAIQEDSGGKGGGRALCWGTGQVAHALALGRQSNFLAQFLPGIGPHDTLV